MAKELNELIGTKAFSNGINYVDPPRNAATATIKSGEGTLAAMTVVARNADGKCIILGEDTTLTPYGIIAEPVDASGTADVVGVIWTTGAFSINNLVVKSGYTMTQADKDALRDLGYVLNESI